MKSSKVFGAVPYRGVATSEPELRSRCADATTAQANAGDRGTFCWAPQSASSQSPTSLQIHPAARTYVRAAAATAGALLLCDRGEEGNATSGGRAATPCTPSGGAGAWAQAMQPRKTPLDTAAASGGKGRFRQNTLRELSVACARATVFCTAGLKILARSSGRVSCHHVPTADIV
jgi:hypothetical protein